MALSGCSDDDFITEYDTHKDEYTVRYNVTYSTTYDFHNIAYVSFTSFSEYSDEGVKYTGKPTQIERSIDGTEDYFTIKRVPKGSHVEFSTYVDVAEALPNTKVEISIDVVKGKEYGFTEVAKATAECPLKGNPLTISYDVPNK
ncbi:MAG: hypothetical protein IJT51_07465 [Bacteroidales bacterium]|nr:hypothetical protein [Bacteroidales bacterium]